jgi:hypothetical protein
MEEHLGKGSLVLLSLDQYPKRKRHPQICHASMSINNISRSGVVRNVQVQVKEGVPIKLSVDCKVKRSQRKVASCNENVQK